VRSFRGTGGSRGIGIGPARLLSRPVHVAERRVARDEIAAELERFEAAVAATDAAMAEIAHESAAVPTEVGDLVDAHRAILKSDEITVDTRTLIRERRLGAEWAVRVVVEKLRPVFAAMTDARFRERFDDVEAVANHLLRTLLAVPEARFDDLGGVIGIALEVSPLDALKLHRTGIAGFATERGGPTSHAAIVARTLGIPYVFAVAGLVDAVGAGETVCIDGERGDLVVAPDPEVAEEFARRRQKETQRRHTSATRRHDPAVTLDGTAVQLGANVESADDIAAAVAAGADHIGLVRTELLYLDRPALPSEDEQLEDALTLIEAAGGRPVTFRTLDIGGDKLPVGVRIAVGPNPALGVRGIRFSLKNLDLFRTQLRALYRASARGPVRIMFPLVSHAAEVVQARAICAEVCAELSQKGVAHDPRGPVGAMIETPSAAMTADHIASVSDFMSVGTNDLIQYAFAADRDNDEVGDLYRPLHPSILRMLRFIFDSAAERGSALSLCGEMAGEPVYTSMLLGLGLRAFSMTASQLSLVRSELRKIDLASAQRLARDALQLASDVEIAALVAEHRRNK
jgi:phosphoenolpyruvate-protein phosphotransferase (PTS system enzyme I)